MSAFYYDPESGFVKNDDEWLTTTDEIHTAMDAEIDKRDTVIANLIEVLEELENDNGHIPGWLWVAIKKEIAKSKRATP